MVETPYGPRYHVDGAIERPDGRNPWVRTVWQIDLGRNYPRLITRRPRRRRKVFEEYERIVLTAEVVGDEGEELKPGDVGAILYIHPNEEAFVVEFVSLDGETAVIATVRSSQARRNNRRRPHTRTNDAGTAEGHPGLLTIKRGQAIDRTEAITGQADLAKNLGYIRTSTLIDQLERLVPTESGHV